MTKFKAGDRVRVADTARIRNGSKAIIGSQIYLTCDMVEDLNLGFPIQARTIPGYSFMADDLTLVTGGAISGDRPYTTEECTSTPIKRGYQEESDLDRMERIMNEEPYTNPAQGQYKPFHTDQWGPAPDVKSMREELKGGPSHVLGSVQYEDDRGIQPILIVRAKKKRRELIVSKLPEGQLIPRR